MKHHAHNITDVQLGMMESTIRRYHCNFIDIVDHENNMILYPKDLMTIFEECENIPLSDRIKTKSDLRHYLSDIEKINVKVLSGDI